MINITINGIPHTLVQDDVNRDPFKELVHLVSIAVMNTKEPIVVVRGEQLGIKKEIRFARRPTQVDDGMMSMEHYIKHGCNIFLTAIINESQMALFQAEEKKET